MPLFLTVFEGSTPATARPIVAISDPGVIAAVRQLRIDRLADAPLGNVLSLKRPKSQQKSPRKRMDEGQE
jgi:hypothetical protein